MHALEGVAEGGVGLVVEGVEVGADGAGEEDGILWDDGEAGAEVVELDLGDVDAVDVDAAGARFEEAEEGEGQGGFACARAAHHADSLVAVDAEADAFEDRRQVGGVSDHQVVDLDAAFGGPGGGRALAVERFSR